MPFQRSRVADHDFCAMIPVVYHGQEFVKESAASRAIAGRSHSFVFLSRLLHDDLASSDFYCLSIVCKMEDPEVCDVQVKVYGVPICFCLREVDGEDVRRRGCLRHHGLALGFPSFVTALPLIVRTFLKLQLLKHGVQLDGPPSFCATRYARERDCSNMSPSKS